MDSLIWVIPKRDTTTGRGGRTVFTPRDSIIRRPRPDTMLRDTSIRRPRPDTSRIRPDTPRVRPDTGRG
jgi:hypothetical protein